MDEDIDIARCSEMYRDSKCEGARNFIRALKREGLFVKQLPGEAATLGTRIHAALEGLPEDLKLAEEELKDECERLAQICIKDWSFLPPEETLYEERFTYKVGTTSFFTGRPDRVSRADDDMLDINFKTGRRASIDPSLNLQLRAEIVLLDHHFHPETIAGTIVEPLVTKKPEIVFYDKKALKQATSEILEIVDRSEWGTKRTAGPWCYYCPARAFCEEARIMALAQPAKIDVSALPLGQEGADWLTLVETAYQVLDAIWEAYSQAVLEGLDPIPGWHISGGKRVRYITNIARAIQLAAERKVKIADLVEHTLPIGKLEERVAEVFKVKGKELDKTFESIFAPVTGKKQTSGSLERIPKSLR